MTTRTGRTDPGAEREAAAFAALLGPVRARLRVAVALEAVAAVAGVVPFVAVAELGRVLLAEGPVDRGRAWAAVAVAAVGVLVRLAGQAAASAVTHAADNELKLDVRRRLVERLGGVRLGWFTERASGAVDNALHGDVDAMHHLVAHARLELASAVVVPVVTLGYLVTVDWRLTVVTALPVVVGMGLMGRTARRFVAHLAQVDAANARIGASVVEFVEGIAVVKTFGQAGQAHGSFRQAADEFADFFMSFVGSLVRPRAVAEAVLSPVTVLLATLAGGALLVEHGSLAPVDVLPFLLLGTALTAPVQTLTFAEAYVRAARAAATRVAELLEVPQLPEPTSRAVPDGNRVTFDQVTFSYDGVHPAVRDIDLVLEPGTVTALVGPSGAGKSTLAALLARFWDVDSGAIRIGGADIRDLDPGDLYRRVTFVFQDVQLLHDTVAANIALADPAASRLDVERAARGAQIHDRITRLPRGYDSVIGEDAHLSGGESQRVSIARALLADRPIVVLDEATAFADPESEAAIQDALANLAAGRTLLVIAHRLASVAGADQIVVLDHGTVAEVGTHEQHLAAGGTYAAMWHAATGTDPWHVSGAHTGERS